MKLLRGGGKRSLVRIKTSNDQSSSYMFDLFRRESSVKIANKIEQLCVLLLQERNKLAGYSLAWSSCSPWSSWPPHEASQTHDLLIEHHQDGQPGRVQGGGEEAVGGGRGHGERGSPGG